MLEQVKTEVKILYSLNHPNIIKLYNHFEDAFSIYFVLEYAEGG
jgi:serine/threonine protein kinase